LQRRPFGAFYTSVDGKRRTGSVDVVDGKVPVCRASCYSTEQRLNEIRATPQPDSSSNGFAKGTGFGRGPHLAHAPMLPCLPAHLLMRPLLIIGIGIDTEGAHHRPMKSKQVISFPPKQIEKYLCMHDKHTNKDRDHPGQKSLKRMAHGQV